MASKQINYYVINKYTKDIVYPYVNGEEDRYRKTDKGVLHIHKGSEGQTTERLLTEQEFPLSEFDRIKKISDEDYCERNKGDVLERRHTVPLSSLDGERCSQVLSAEDTYFNTLYKDDECNEYLRMIKNARGIINECLTGVQKRRLIMYYCKGLSLEEIAKATNLPIEKVKQMADMKE